MNILGIETSCDETGVAVYSSQHGIQAQALYSQIKLHADYGGVVPELASRDHVRKLLPLIEQTLQQANLDKRVISAIAYTRGPGLIGALLVGSSVARALAFALDIPSIGVHHMEGHLVAPMLADDKPSYPFVALLVSGGHSMLVDVAAPGTYQLLGESVDDAAGEAFDKTAKLLGLDYPGGPKLAKLAEQGRANVYRFPRPMTDRPGLEFSFSGLKTFALNTVQQSDGTPQDFADIAYAFQEAVIDTLRIKISRALQQTNRQQVVIAGGVSANLQLRKTLAEVADKEGFEVFYPPLAYCTDNGAMIAYAGWLRAQSDQYDSPDTRVKPRWPLHELAAL